MGINLAESNDLNRAIFSHSKKMCVFISHKKEDEKAALAIGDYLMKEANLDIYLDVRDCVLQEAVSTDNDNKIVESIQRGLEISSHLLCLISDKTKLSWWVPFEIGYATKLDIDIASLQLKTVDEVPSYIKIQKVVKTTDEFIRHICTINHYGDAFFDINYKHLNESDKTVLNDFIR